MRFHVGPHAPCTTHLFVLVGGDGDELRLGERLAADHLLDASDLHDVYPRLVLVQRVQHNLWGEFNLMLLFINSRPHMSSRQFRMILRSSGDGAVK